MYVTSRKIYAQHFDSISEVVTFPKSFSRSGGTSGSSIKLHTDLFKKLVVWIVIWFLRAKHRVYPWSRGCSIWGHGHLVSGTRLKDKMTANQRERDKPIFKLSRIRKFSVYDLSNENLIQAVRYFSHPKTKFLICYGGILPLLIRAFYLLGHHDLDLNGKIVISTSDPASAAAIKKLNKLGIDVVQEYGMAEVGVVGYSKPNQLEISYMNPFIAISIDINRQILITTKWSWMPFPLDMYETGDYVEHFEKGKIETSLGPILGKNRMICELADRQGQLIRFSVVSLDHFLKGFDTVKSISFIKEEDSLKITIEGSEDRLLSSARIADFLNSELNARFSKNQFTIAYTDKSQATIAGKGYSIR